MTRTIASVVDLEMFLAQVWGQRVDLVARDILLMTSEASFSATVAHVAQAVADCGQNGAPGVRFYLGGVNLSTSREIAALLPCADDASWSDYGKRVERSCDGRDWCLVINDPPRYTPAFDATCAAFFEPLLERVGVPLTRFSTELFVGRYAHTPFAIHTDPGLESFYCMLQGTKRLSFWAPEYWKRRNFDYPPDVRDLSPTDRNAADVRELGPGDLLYWPADFWHVGETPTFAVALGVSLVRPTARQAGARLRRLALAALDRLAGPNEAEPFLPMAAREPWNLVPTALMTEASRLRKAATYLEDELQSLWLAVCSNRGSFDAMAPGSEMYPRDNNVADGSWVVALEPSVILAWRRNCHGTLVVAARGARWDCIDHPTIIALLIQLRTGESVPVIRHLAHLPPEDPTTLDQSDVLALIAVLHSAKVLRRVEAA